MSPQNSLIPAHPQGEGFSALVSSVGDSLLPAMAVDTVGRRFHVEWDPQAPVTPLGQLVFFCQFLAAGGLYAKWVADCPLHRTSPNAPSLKDLLGAWVPARLPLLADAGVEVVSEPVYEYVVLVTSLEENLLTIAHLYRQRADVNAY